jgi:hypothetical protein
MGIFELAQTMINQSALGITGGLRLGNDAMMDALLMRLENASIGDLMGLYLETQIAKLGLSIMALIIFVVVCGRMIEIYLVMSIAPIPFATMANREWGSMGNNYLKTLFALAFQGFLIMVCMAIYAVLIYVIPISWDIHAALWTVMGYTALLCFMLIKSGGLAKSLFGSH